MSTVDDRRQQFGFSVVGGPTTVSRADDWRLTQRLTSPASTDTSPRPLAAKTDRERLAALTGSQGVVKPLARLSDPRIRFTLN